MITVKVPATTANLGPGFDTLGMALSIFLEVKMAYSKQGNILHIDGIDADKLSSKPEQNLIIQAADYVFVKAGQIRPEIAVSVHNTIPIGKGLGSSASAIAAGMLGANALLGSPFSLEDLISWAVQMEGHADNIVPAFVGGLTVSLVDGQKVLYEKLPVPHSLQLVVLVPEFTLETSTSRSVLPQQIRLEEAVASMQRTCLLVAGLARGRVDHLRWAMDDLLIEPVRKQFIPHFDQVVQAARAAGAVGVAMSGAGPSIMAFTEDKQEQIGCAMLEAFQASAHILYPEACDTGAQVYFSKS